MPPTVWRIKLNSGRPDVTDWDGARAYCREASVVGLGWGDVAGIAAGASLAEVLAAVEATPGWAPTGPRMIRRLAEGVSDGDLMWTRDRRGAYWLGRVTGGWFFDDTPGAVEWDLGNVRPCEWVGSPFRDYEIPGSVVRNFAGTGETLRRIKQPAAMRVTEMLWARSSDPRAPLPSFSVEEVLSDLLDPIDVEDIVLIWLQAQGWILLPSSRMHDTPMYEAALRNRSGELAVVSVKSGDSAPVPIRDLADAAGEAQPFAFSTHDRFTEPPGDHGVRQITREEIVEFVRRSPELLPPRASRWLSSL